MALEIEYTPAPVQRRFMESNAKMRVLMGPVGCLAPETLVVTEYGLLPIAHIDRPMRVLSWNTQTCQFQLSWCGGSFPKGMDYLYRVVTSQGEFAANGHHRVYAGSRAYCRVQSLVQGQSISQYSGTLPMECLVHNLLLSQPDDPRARHKAENSLARYAASARRRGLKFLEAEQPMAPQKIEVPPETSAGFIIGINRETVKRSYWDIQVLDTNNYVTADGTIHHNSGKSVTCCFEVVRRASMQTPNAQGIRKTRALVIRETARQLLDTTIKTWNDWFPPGVCGDYMRTTKTYFLKVGDVECEVMFRALDDADDVANLESLEVTFAWMNECRNIHPDILDPLSKRVGRYPAAKDGGPTWYGMWGDTNPPTMDTWWYYMMEGLDPKDGTSAINNGWDVFKQPSGRSPYAENVENLPSGYYDTQGRSEEYIRVYIDGEYGLSSAGMPVYKYFRPDYHMSRNPLRAIVNGVRPVVVGMDLGLTPAAVIGQQDPRGRALIMDECVSFDMGVQRFVRTMLKPLLYERFLGVPVIVVTDPAGLQRVQTDERSAVDIIKAEGLRVMPARTNNPTARINAVDEYLMRQVDGDPAFLVDPRCTRLKAAMMGGYRFKPKGDGDIDKNKHSHCAEALQYLMLHLHNTQGEVLARKRDVRVIAATGWT